MREHYEFYMREALKEAKTALREGNFPIGCVVELDGKILGRTHNEIHSSGSRLAHAELRALEEVNPILFQKENRGRATLYSTFEPCPMCLGAAVFSHIGTIVYAINPDLSGATSLLPYTPEFFKRTRKEIEVVGGILEQECLEVFMNSDVAQKMLRKGYLYGLSSPKE